MNQKIIKVRLLREGVFLSGGARFEEFLLDSIRKKFITDSIEYFTDRKVFARIFYGIQNVLLIANGWKFSNADVNIVTARIALSSIFRNLFSRNKTIIVLHNFDENDGKSLWLKYYFKFLFFILSLNPPRVCIVCVSPYFLTFFQNKFKKLPVYLIPNLFQNSKYQINGGARNVKKILLGQYSEKNDASVYELARMLSMSGYYCFFLTLNPDEAAKKEYFEIRHVSFDEYLFEMANSHCSISLSGVDEGWPRMVHESILVGTPVIGYDRGGLGDLLRESDSYIVNSAEEAFELIKNSKVLYRTPEIFAEKYDISNVNIYLDPLMNFIF